jgi:hypothetical protein
MRGNSLLSALKERLGRGLEQFSTGKALASEVAAAGSKPPLDARRIG